MGIASRLAGMNSIMRQTFPTHAHWTAPRTALSSLSITMQWLKQGEIVEVWQHFSKELLTINQVCIIWRVLGSFIDDFMDCTYVCMCLPSYLRTYVRTQMVSENSGQDHALLSITQFNKLNQGVFLNPVLMILSMYCTVCAFIEWSGSYTPQLTQFNTMAQSVGWVFLDPVYCFPTTYSTQNGQDYALLSIHR